MSRLIPLLILFPFLIRGAPEPIRSDFGIFYRDGTDVEGHHRTTAAGPLWEVREDDQGRTFQACRPLFARSSDANLQATQWEGLFPLVGGFTLGKEYYNRVLLLFRKVKDVTREDSPQKWVFFPFYFQGISNRGVPYFAIFPLGGTVRDFLSRDEVHFFLWPLFTRSRIKDVETNTWLFPFFSTTHGGGVERRRFFPLYGESRVKNQFVKKFILWPFWNSVQYLIPGSEGSGFILWPLYGRIKLADQDTTYVIPPFFRFSKGKADERTTLFWPVYQHATGSVEKTYFFPLWGTKKIGTITRSFFLWPVGGRSRNEAFDETSEYVHVWPFWHSADITPVATNSTRHAVSREFWPLFSYQRENDHSRFRMLELWPGRDPEGVERNWSPLFSPFTRERKGENVDTEIFWGLVRNIKRGPDYRHFSIFPFMETRREASDRRFTLLKGLFETSVHDGKRSVRLLYFIKI